MHFGFTLGSSDIDLWNDAHLDLWDTGFSSKHFFCLQNVLTTSSIQSSRRLQYMSSSRLQDICSRHLQDMSSRCLQDKSSRRLQRNNFLSFKKLLRYRCDEDVFKTCLRTSWRRLEEQQIFAGLFDQDSCCLYLWINVIFVQVNYDN